MVCVDVESVLPSRAPRRAPKKTTNESREFGVHHSNLFPPLTSNLPTETSEDILATLGTVVNNLCENVRLRNKDAPMHVSSSPNACRLLPLFLSCMILIVLCVLPATGSVISALWSKWF